MVVCPDLIRSSLRRQSSATRAPDPLPCDNGESAAILAYAQTGTCVTYVAGDTVVHPRHGVASVEQVTTRTVGAEAASFLELSFPLSSLRVLVPLDAVDEVGIRRLPTEGEAAAVLALLAQPSDVAPLWTERAATTRVRMHAADLEQISTVVRDLLQHARRSGKALSPAESADLKVCLERVCSELAPTLGLTIEDARALVLETAGSER